MKGSVHIYIGPRYLVENTFLLNEWLDEWRDSTQEAKSTCKTISKVSSLAVLNYFILLFMKVGSFVVSSLEWGQSIIVFVQISQEGGRQGFVCDLRGCSQEKPGK